MNSFLDKEEKNTEMHTALDVIEGKKSHRSGVVNEEVMSFNRGGRNGRSVAARLGGELDSSPAAQSAQSLGTVARKTLHESQGTQEQFRVVIAKEANDCLESIVKKVNHGLEDGAVNRSGIANYVFQNLSRLLTDADLKSLRAQHFDERKALGSILKSNDELPEEVKKALRDYYGISEIGKKRSVRASVELSTEASVDNS